MTSSTLSPAPARDLAGRSIGILAGGGRLPEMIAENVLAHGGRPHIVGLIGEADAGIARFPHTWVNWAQIGRMLRTLRTDGGGEVVIAGGVTRPDLFKLRPDLGFFRVLPQLVRMLAGGDDSVLTRVVRVLEAQGLTVRGAHEVAPDLLAQAGPLGTRTLADAARDDARIGFAVRQALGPLDAGQAVVVAHGKVLAIEGAEGTDAMLARVAAARSSASDATGSGVLAKGPKPGQELRVDMPAIGPRTVQSAHAAGLAGVVVEAGGVLVLDRAETVRVADALGCALEGLAQGTVAGQSRQPLPHRDGQSLTARQPSARDLIDIETGLAAMARLAPFGAGQSSVVARAFILGLAANETAQAVLQRVATLRQWGVGRRYRVGVLVHRAEAGFDRAAAEGLLQDVAKQGLSGFAVVGAPEAIEALRACARAADAAGIFLVGCECPAAEPA